MELRQWNVKLFLEQIYPCNDSIFIKDSAPSHRANIVQNLLKQKLKKCFQKNTEWPASSSDRNARVYHGRFYNPFTKKDELQSKIIKAWWFHKRLERNLQSLETISFEIELLSIETVEHKNFAIFTGKETPRQEFSCKYCEIFKNTYFEEHLRTAA